MSSLMDFICLGWWGVAVLMGVFTVWLVRQDLKSE